MTNTIKDTELDNVLRVLTSHYRRWILHLLIEQKATTIDELVIELCTLGEGVDENITEAGISTRLHHVDLPKLVDIGVINYDSEREKIVLIEYHEELQDLLATTKKWEDPVVQSQLP